MPEYKQHINHRTLAATWPGLAERLQALKWALIRLAMQAHVIFCLLTVLGGALTYPLVTYLMFRDWRFWRYIKYAVPLYFFLVRCAWLLLTQGGHYGFLFSVPLTAPPVTLPDRRVVRLQESWRHGSSCGDCIRCCAKIDCPVVDPEKHICTGFDSPYWRYFNCGRFPITQRQLDYYACPKWELRPPKP